jgi:hypothetical protein
VAAGKLVSNDGVPLKRCTDIEGAFHGMQHSRGCAAQRTHAAGARCPIRGPRVSLAPQTQVRRICTCARCTPWCSG